VGDFFATVRGRSPVRCLDCGHRSLANLLQFEKLPFARCPKCFSLRLEIAQNKGYHHTTFTRSVMLLLGARRYRCPSCRYNFLSFRVQDPESMQAVADPDTGEPGFDRPLDEVRDADTKASSAGSS
jgi:DNA-directed RNA polymerase subunit RPC12/RpoP